MSGTSGRPALRPPDPPLEDGEIVLRRWRPDDADEIAAACRDPEIVRWLPFPDPYSRQDAITFIAESAAQFEAGTAADLAIAARDSGVVLGAVGLHFVGPQRCAVGYRTVPAARGRGVATRAARLIAGWAFRDFPIARLELYALAGNTASRRVAERAGCTYEGVLRRWLVHRGDACDAAMYSMLREEAPQG